MPKIEGLNHVLNKLNTLAADSKANDNVSCVVGYTQNYALQVHENLSAFHPTGQAKYLEQPAREMAKDLGDMVLKVMLKTGNMGKGLLVAGLALQRASQELVPVDTGALKNSAFTRIDR